MESPEQLVRLRSMFNGLPCGTVALDHAGAVLEASARAADLLDVPVPQGVDFQALLTERFEMRALLRDEDLERGVQLRTEHATLWVHARRCAAEAAAGRDAAHRMVAVTDITPFSQALDERATSLRFLLHDLRSPLNSISALTQLDASDPDAFERCGGMQQITQLANYVLSLGEQFIFASVSDHLLARDFRRFDVRETLRQVISQMEVTALYCGVPLQLWMPGETPVWVSGMRNFASRAIQNIVDNAVRASPRGSGVAVSFRMVGEYAEIVVSDRAGGLPGLREGERLSDFDGLGRKTATGFGLGLKLAVQIVELHRGTLYAQMNGDDGTTFVLRFPCLVASATRPAARVASLADFDRMRRAHDA